MKIYLILACALSLSACGNQLTSQQDISKQPRPGPAVCPDCHRPAWESFTRGTTWTVLGKQNNLSLSGGNIVTVGADAQTDALQGDTDLTVSLPILCIAPLAPGFTTPDQANSQIQAQVAISATKLGSKARPLAASDFTCQQDFGNGWRMAYNTDAPDLKVLVAYGQIAPKTRFWIAIDQKPTRSMP